MLKIQVDDREPKEIYFALVRLGIEKDFEVEWAHLEVGDYACGDVIIERKEASDFIGSIRDRLPDQLAKMSLNYKNRFLIIQGDPWKVMTGMNSRSIIGMQVSLILRYQVGLIHVPDIEGFIWAVYTLFNKYYEGRVFVPEEYHIIKGKRTPEDVKTGIIASIPGIGRAKARKVVEYYNGSFQEMLKRLDELDKIDGIGPKIKEKIKGVFDY